MAIRPCYLMLVIGCFMVICYVCGFVIGSFVQLICISESGLVIGSDLKIW